MMHGNGLTKLVEECGELAQVAAKKLAYPDTDDHPDGAGSLLRRIEDEIADVRAAAAFVSEKMGLNITRIEARRRKKLLLYKKWDNEE